MTLFIGNLSYDVRQREIEDIFSRYGRVSRVDLKRGYCFVEYEDKRDAEDALRTEHGSSLAGSKMSVEWAKSDRKSSNSNDCFKCGKPGHWARDCPDNGGGGGGGGKRGRSRSRSRDRDRYSRGRDRSRSRDRDRDRDRRRSPAGRSRSPLPRRDRSRSRSPRRD